MAHLAIEFPRDVAAGCQALIERRDEIVMLASGREETNQRWEHARRSWQAGLGIRSAADLAAVVDLFEAARGRANSFNFRDWLDWRSAPPHQPITAQDQRIGTGDGTSRAFQLVKAYGRVNPYLRPITQPHPASVLVAVGGTARATGWTLAPNGRIIFDVAPPASALVTAGFTFDVPVRFDTATLALEWAYFSDDGAGVGSAPDITLTEVRLDE